MDVLLRPKPDDVTLTNKTPCEQPSDYPTEVIERERKSGKARLKLPWELKFQKAADG